MLSEYVEETFRAMVKRVIGSSYSYGLEKYGHPLATHNGRVGDWEEEWVSLGRYVTQMEMELRDCKELLKSYAHGHYGSLNCKCSRCDKVRVITNA